MLWLRRLGTVVVPVVVACLAGGLTAQPAAAGPVSRTHDRVVVTLPTDEICGVAVVTTMDIVANEQVRLDRSGFPLFQLTQRGVVTFTNPDNGNTVVRRFTGNIKNLSAEDNGDGTVTFRIAWTGIPQQLRLADGRMMVQDVGRAVFVVVLDYKGTPTDVYDDEFVSERVESVSGPHPILDSNYALACEVVVAELT